jgi:hypothetical protein
MLQSKAGYIDARPLPPLDEILLRRTAGPYIGSFATFRTEAAPPVMSAAPRNRPFRATPRLVAKCHVWTAPSWQGLSSRLQHWSVQPCVRPLGAVHMTAGHNALRGSGPGQQPAFDNALALVGCPDRRIDRLCITCCSPSQPSHHAGCPTRSRLRRKRDGFLVSLALGHHSPDHSRDLVGECDGGNLRRPPRK